MPGFFSQINRNTTLRHGVLFTVFSFLNSGVGFLLLLILANYIEADDYGQLNLFNITVQLLTFIISLSTAGYLSVCFFKKTREEFKLIINSVLLISSYVAIAFGAVLIVFAPTFERLIGIDIEYQWIALMVCYLQVFNSINLDIWRLEEAPVKYGIYSLSSCLLNFAITLLLVISYHKGWQGRVYAQATVAIIFFVISGLFLLKRRYLTFRYPRKHHFIETLKFGVPLIPHQTAFWIRQSLDRYLINYFLTITTVGYYGFAFNFGNIMTIIGSAFNASFSVSLFKDLKEGYEQNKSKLKRATRIMLVFYALMTIIIVIGCHIVIPVILPNYIGSLPFILPLSLSGLFICYYMLYVNYLFYYEKTRQLMYITILISIIQMITSFLVTKFGAIYTAYANSTFSFAIFIAVYFYSKKVLKNENQH